jgi:hypothetical protein
LVSKSRPDLAMMEPAADLLLRVGTVSLGVDADVRPLH